MDARGVLPAPRSKRCTPTGGDARWGSAHLRGSVAPAPRVPRRRWCRARCAGVCCRARPTQSPMWAVASSTVVARVIDGPVCGPISARAPLRSSGIARAPAHRQTVGGVSWYPVWRRLLLRRQGGCLCAVAPSAARNTGAAISLAHEPAATRQTLLPQQLRRGGAFVLRRAAVMQRQRRCRRGPGRSPASRRRSQRIADEAHGLSLKPLPGDGRREDANQRGLRESRSGADPLAGPTGVDRGCPLIPRSLRVRTVGSHCPSTQGSHDD
jgi:hypothetical protein